MLIPEILAQMYPATLQSLPFSEEELAKFLAERYGKRHQGLPALRLESTVDFNWSVTLPGIGDPAYADTIQIEYQYAGSRGYWPTLRHALLASILIEERPELPIRGTPF